jgi:hypothetical protein
VSSNRCAGVRPLHSQLFFVVQSPPAYPTPSRPLIFIAHPDDETLACGGLLQRVPASLVVFATEGAAPGFGCERMFGSLKAYSDVRFQEASRALAHVPNASFKPPALEPQEWPLNNVVGNHSHSQSCHEIPGNYSFRTG